jgi:hypothetical protein
VEAAVGEALGSIRLDEALKALSRQLDLGA